MKRAKKSAATFASPFRLNRQRYKKGKEPSLREKIMNMSEMELALFLWHMSL